MSNDTAPALSVEERYALLRSVGEECIQENELRNLIEKKPLVRCYDGFEPSGRMHIAQGIFKAVNVNKCTMAGCEFVFWVADWFALMNDKVGGEMERIRIVGEYLVEVWKAAGMDMEKVVFRWSSEDITNSASTYWRVVLDIARRNTIARIKKCCTIMGKNEGTLTAAQILYPLMQCSDIFYLKADICQLGLDQRKVNMLAREYCDLTGRKLKPIILSHHMLAGLKQGQAKMSKSDPDSAIFMEDSAEDVERKIRAAYCPRVAQQENVVTEDGLAQPTDDKNPVLDYYQCIIFARPGGSIDVAGTNYTSFADLERDFLEEKISEEQLKSGLIAEINRLLDPVRSHFVNDDRARELLALVKTYRKSSSGDAEPAPTPAANAEAEAAPAPARPHLVCYLPACTKLTLDTAHAIVTSLNGFLAKHTDGEASATLVLPDWSAVATNEITGEEKDIAAALQYNAALLTAKGLSPAVRVVLESDMILGDSNAFWTRAINAGRKLTLARIEEDIGELKNAGVVVSVLMRVAGVDMLGATHVQDLAREAGLNRVHATADPTVQHLPATEGLITPLYSPDAPVPPNIADYEIYLDDTELDLRRKIKKAYCAPEERENPVTALSAYLISVMPDGLTVERRKTEEGVETNETVRFTEAEPLKADMGAGKMHPADLKPAVIREMVTLAAPVQTALSTAEIKKLSQAVRNVEKKLAKKK